MGTKCIYLISLLLLWGCSSSPNDESSYLEWIADPDNGLIKVKQTEIFEMKVQYLPSSYRAWKEIQTQPLLSDTQKDSIHLATEESLHFIFTIALREDKASGDVIYSGVNDKADFEQRVYTLNFGMEQYWALHTNLGEYAPVLTNMENSYSLTDYRKIHLLFAPSNTSTHFHEADQWDLVFTDEVFGTGIHHFVFFKEDWEDGKYKF